MLMLILVFFECSLYLSTYIENSVQSHLKINTMGSCLFKPKACFINFIRNDHSCKILYLYTDCGKEYTLEHGHVEFYQKDTTYGSSLSVICDIGYEIKGGPEIICMHQGSWSNSTYCEIKGLLFFHICYYMFILVALQYSKSL